MVGKTCACGNAKSSKAKRCGPCADATRRALLADLNRRPVPPDFETAVIGMSIEKIGMHYRAGTATVRRWLQERPVDRGYMPTNGWGDRPLPEDFAQLAPKLNRRELRQHYGVGSSVLGRWLAEARVEPRRQVFTAQPGGKPFQPHRDTSREGQAARFLQQFGPVFRSDPDGTPNPKGTHFRRSSFVLTGEEIIQRAVRNGWDENSWRRVA